MTDDMVIHDEAADIAVNKETWMCKLPPYLKASLENMKKSWEIEDSGQRDLHWDLCWGELNADINSAEVDRVITSEQTWYLRETYLRMKRE